MKIIYKNLIFLFFLILLNNFLFSEDIFFDNISENIEFITTNSNISTSSYNENDLFEEELFQDTETVVSSSNILSTSIVSNIEKESVSFSGVINCESGYEMNKEWLKTLKNNWEKNIIRSSINGNILMDIRLLSGIKSFINLSLYLSPQNKIKTYNFYSYEMSNIILITNTNLNSQGLPISNIIVITNIIPITSNYTITNKTYLYYEQRLTTNQKTYFETNKDPDFSLKEFFIDFNINKIIYFRLGKQVLQWGRSFFWSPTDLINIEKRDFLNLTGYREGNYGLKFHIPYGTTLNFYGFYETSDLNNLDKMPIALKFEFLIYKTEISISSWFKKDYKPIYGFDFSSRLWDFDIRGEISLSYGENRNRITKIETNIIFSMGTTSVTNTFYIPSVYKPVDKLIKNISLGFTRTFDWFDEKQKIMLTGEIFYNESGYDKPILQDDVLKYGLFIYNLYVPNYYSLLYGALFLNINKFIISEINMGINLLCNLIDYSSIIYLQLQYNPVNHFNIIFNITGILGNDNCEFTLRDNRLSSSIRFSLNF